MSHVDRRPTVSDPPSGSSERAWPRRTQATFLQTPPDIPPATIRLQPSPRVALVSAQAVGVRRPLVRGRPHIGHPFPPSLYPLEGHPVLGRPRAVDSVREG